MRRRRRPLSCWRLAAATARCCSRTPLAGGRGRRASAWQYGLRASAYDSRSAPKRRWPRVRSEAVLDADLHLVRLGERAAERVEREATEACIFELQAERGRHVVAQPDAVVHPLAAGRDRAAGERQV